VFAHIGCIESPTASSGRYIVSSTKSISNLEIAQTLKAKFSQYPIPTTQFGEIVNRFPDVSNEKALKTLGFTKPFRDLETTLVDMVNGLIDMGLISKI